MKREILGEGQAKLTLTASRTEYAELFSAFEYGEILTYRLDLAEGFMADSASIRLFRDDDGRTLVIPGECREKGFVFRVDTSAICSSEHKRGLFYFLFDVGNGIISQNEFGEGLIYSESEEDCSSFQLSVYQPESNRPTGFEGGIMYQIFPDRFYKGEKEFYKDGAVMEEDWNRPISEYQPYPGAPVKNNHFYGGNLFGIAAKLDYLKELGVTMLYLNPIFEAASNHRYDTGDYSKVDSLLGGEEGLRLLIKEAKEQGIAVILDGVFNHTGDDSLYFNRYGRYSSLGAYQSLSSPYSSWYFFDKFPDNYSCWWGIPILPKLNSRNPDCISYIAGKNGIIEKYLKMGVSGWRLDVADELSDEMLDAISETVHKRDLPGIVYGEVWEDASNKIAYSKRRHYFTGGQLDGVMNYPLKNAIIAFVTEGDGALLYYTMKILYAHYPKAVSDMQMNILSTHDTERILTVLAGAPLGAEEGSVLAVAKLTERERKEATEKLKLAALLQMTLPGIPCIYYGDEIGMEGYRDPFNRQPYPWGKEDTELLSYYKALCAMRRKYPVFKDGYYRGVHYENGLFSFERFNERERLKVIVNLTGRTYLEEFSGSKTDILNGRSISDGVALPSGRGICLFSTVED